MEPIGLIAGNGQFPILFAQAAARHGRRVIALAHEGETVPEIERFAHQVTWIKVGQVGKMIRTFHAEHVREAVMCGGISKVRMFDNVSPDLRGAVLWFKMRKRRQDDSLLRALAREFEQEGIQIRESTLYVPSLLAQPKCYTRRKPSKREQADMEMGFRIAKKVGELDVGQALVVKNGAVVAVEAIEGTDAMILRGGRLAGKNAVVIKVAKPHQDLRFDVPSVGVQTVRTMAEAGCSALAVDAGKTLMFDEEALVWEADEHGMCIVGIEGDL